LAEEPRDDDGRPYHIRLSKEDVGRIAFLPGDPGRVPKIAERFSNPKDLGFHREYRAIAGRIGGEKVVALSTGIGGPAAAIAIEELARLVGWEDLEGGSRTRDSAGQCAPRSAQAGARRPALSPTSGTARPPEGFSEPRRRATTWSA